jgi:propionate CoA-transferase
LAVKLTNKIVSADEASAVLQDGDTVAIQGFVGIGVPDELILALERRFLKTKHPCGLTLLLAAAPGDGAELSVNKLAHDGLLKRVIGSHFALIPRLAETAVAGKFEAYNLPLGSICHLLRDIAARRPGHFTKVGLGTFVDPRLDGGKLNLITTEDIVELREFDGGTWLFYKTFPVNVALIRATTADPDGNVTMERGALVLDVLPFAMAQLARTGDRTGRARRGKRIPQSTRGPGAGRSRRLRCRRPAGKPPADLCCFLQSCIFRASTRAMVAA